MNLKNDLIILLKGEWYHTILRLLKHNFNLQTLTIDPCFYFGDVHKGTVAGPLLVQDDLVFVPKPVDTSNVRIFSRFFI